jgi:hypothetical protein
MMFLMLRNWASTRLGIETRCQRFEARIKVP